MGRRNIQRLVRVVSAMADQARRALYRREARAFVVSWSAAVIGGCAIPGPSSDRASIRSLERVAYAGLNGKPLSYLREGDASMPRLIYVHGSPSDATSFADDLLDPLPGFESISIDRPGYGDASHTGTVESFAEQAAAIEPLLVERGGRWPILVGHSLGGPIIARAAADYPGRVGGLVIVAGSLDPELEQPRWFNYLADAPPVRWLLPKMIRVSNDEMLAAPRETKLLEDVLTRVRCPVAIVHGTRDGLVPYANVAYTQRQLTNAASITVTTLEGEGHFLVWKDEGREAIRDAIRSVESGMGQPRPAGADRDASDGAAGRNPDQ
ncbi:MAG: alpha/beta hydrolase [Planctomycetota bacterium]